MQRSSKSGVLEHPGVTASLHAAVETQATSCPDDIAVIGDDGEITYRELVTRAHGFAARLANAGVRPGDRVAIFAERSANTIAGVLGALQTGAAYLPLDPAYPASRLAYMLEDGAPAAVLCQRHLRAQLPPTLAPVIEADALATSETKTDLPQTAPHDACYVIYTSGSTGRPKGVVMPHLALLNLLRWHRAEIPLRPGERVLQFAPLSFDVSAQEIFGTLSEGGTLVLMNDGLRRDPEGLLNHLSAHQVERLYLPFVALHQLAEAAIAMPSLPPLALRDVITAGEQLHVTPAIRAFFQRVPDVRLHNHYGPTETHVVTAYTLAGDPGNWPGLPPIGRPIANTAVHVLDEQRNPVPPGREGELYFSGACLAQGYLNRPELTEARFVKGSDSTGGARMYRTGDLGRVLPDGVLEYLGRADDQVKIRGHRVELGEVESTLRQHPDVADCAVVAQSRGPEKILVAHVQLRSGRRWQPEALRNHLTLHLPEALVPAAFGETAAFPLTPSGKVDRRSLPPLALGSTAGATPVTPPQTELEQRIANVWEAVLGWSGVGVLDSFFDVGGTSVLMAEVQRRLRRELDRELPIALLFQFPTIRQLAKNLAGGDQDNNTRNATIVERATRQREAAMRAAAARVRNRTP